MTPNDADLFFISYMAAPVLMVGFGLFMFWFTGWLDRREERRRHPAE